MKFLFLQSHPSLFGRDVIKYMRKRGIDCRLINLSLGDWGYRIGLGADNYRGTLTDWPHYLRTYLEREQITDIVYYADQRPYNRIAYRIARERKINAYAYEFGYLRPDWITLERGAMGPYSHFPNDPAVIRKLAADVVGTMATGHFPYSFLAEATNEVAYNLVPALLPFFFRHYERDRYYHPFRDYPSYLPRLLRRRANEAKAAAIVEQVTTGDKPYFIVPMQMQNDYQVRNHAGYAHLHEMVDEVIASFVRSSDPEQRLIFKLHPLDNNIENWPRVIREIAEAYRCAERVVVIDGGNLADLYKHAKGVVVLNSTAGLTALRQGTPVKVLGISIYDVAQMTCQKPLDQFWTAPSKPDPALVADFVKLLAASVQVKGNFFSSEGRRTAIPEFVRRLLDGKVNGHGAFLEEPPRLERAKQIGVPIPQDSYWHETTGAQS